MKQHKPDDKKALREENDLLKKQLETLKAEKKKVVAINCTTGCCSSCGCRGGCRRKPTTSPKRSQTVHV